MMRVLVILVALCAASGARAQLFLGLGHLPGGVGGKAFGVSADGRVVVGIGDSDVSDREPFRWTAAGMQGLGLMPNGLFASCNAVSGDGSTAVGEMILPSQAYRWTLAGGYELLDVLPGYTGGSSQAYAVSGDGSVVVGESVSTLGVHQAFRWNEAQGMQPLGFLPGGTSSVATGVSADGSVIVGYGDSSNGASEAFRWTEGDGMQGLGDLAGGNFFSSAADVSADGSIVVGTGSGTLGQDAIHQVGAADMESLGNFAAHAFGVSGDGSVIVGQAAFGFGHIDEAFVWDRDHGIRRLATVLATDLHLDLSTWYLGPALAVSADGNTIVGWGTDPAGHVEAWLARLPEPDAALLQVAALAVLAALGWRER